MSDETTTRQNDAMQDVLPDNARLTAKAISFFEKVRELEGHEFWPSSCDTCKKLWKIEVREGGAEHFRFRVTCALSDRDNPPDDNELDAAGLNAQFVGRIRELLK